MLSRLMGFFGRVWDALNEPFDLDLGDTSESAIGYYVRGCHESDGGYLFVTKSHPN